MDFCSAFVQVQTQGVSCSDHFGSTHKVLKYE